MASRLQKMKAAQKSKKLTSAVSDRSANVIKRGETSRVSNLKQLGRTAPRGLAGNAQSGNTNMIQPTQEFKKEFTGRFTGTSAKDGRAQYDSTGKNIIGFGEKIYNRSGGVSRTDATQNAQGNLQQNSFGNDKRLARDQVSTSSLNRAQSLRNQVATGFENSFGQRAEAEKARMLKQAQLLEAGADPNQTRGGFNAVSGLEDRTQAIGEIKTPKYATGDLPLLKKTTPTRPKAAGVDNQSLNRLVLDISRGAVDPNDLTDEQMNMLAGGGVDSASNPMVEFLAQRRSELEQQKQLQAGADEQARTGEILDFRTQQKLDRESQGRQDAQTASKSKEAIADAAGAGGFASSAAAEAMGDVDSQLTNILSRRREIDQLNAGKFTRQLDDQAFQNQQAIDSQIANLGFEMAKEQAKINQSSMADPFTAIKNLKSILPEQTKSQVDWTGSKLMGHMVDKNGDPILDGAGQQRPIGAEATGGKEWATTKLKNGETLWYNKNNPNERVYEGNKGSSYFEDDDEPGLFKTSETSNIENTNVVGPEQEPELYEKKFTYEDGEAYSLADNCVKFAREFGQGAIDGVFGLFTVDDKKRAIETSGNKDPNTFQEGDVLLTSEGNVGHAAIIKSIDEEGNMTLLESNYAGGKVTDGRVLSKTDSKVLGTLPGNISPAGIQKFGDEDREGSNDAILQDAKQDYELDIEVQAMLDQIKSGKMTPSEIGETREELFKRAKTDEEKAFIGNKFGRALDKVEQIDFKQGIRSAIRQSSVNQKPPSQGERESITKALTTMDQIGGLKDQFAILADSGKVGPIKGAAIGLNPYDKDAKVIKAQLKQLVPNLARGIFGEVGVLTDADINNYISTLPNLRSTEEQADALLGMTVKVIQNGVERKLKTMAATGLNVANLEFVLDELDTFSESMANGIIPQSSNPIFERAAGASSDPLNLGGDSSFQVQSSDPLGIL